jgi:hypothetical protein
VTKVLALKKMLSTMLTMNKKTVLIVLLIVFFISVASFSTYLLTGVAQKETDVTGKVLDTSPSLRAIHIIPDDRNEEEIFTVALSDDTQLISGTGSPITLEGIQPGMRIKAAGKLIEGDGLLARQILVY